jgi:hypothetical protein
MGKFYNTCNFSNLKNKFFLFIKNIKNLTSILLSQKWVYKINTAISLILLWLSPLLCLLWLIIPVAYLAYKKALTLSSLSKILIPIFTMWYLIMWVSLINYGPVITIGPGYTDQLMVQLLDDEIFCKRICYSSVLWLHVLSTKIGVPIYLPFFKFFSGPKKTACAENEEKKPQQNSSWNFFGSGEPEKTQKEKDAENCQRLAEQMARAEREMGHQFFHTDDRISDDQKRKSMGLSISFFHYFEQNFCYTTANKKKSKKK